MLDTADVFISHAWKYAFLDVVAAVEAHFLHTPDMVIWFDVFSNNQHKAGGLPFVWWQTTFRSAIEDFKHTVLVLAPWNDPVVFTRAWCLFEIFTSVDTQSRFEVALTPTQRADFVDALCSDGGSYFKMLATIQLEKSEAFNPQDKENIFRIVREGVGFHRLNCVVLERVRGAVAEVMEMASKENGLDFEEKIRRKMAMATLRCDQGEYDRALPLYEECLAKRKRVLGDHHPFTLTSLNNLAALFKSKGEYDRALPLYEECLAKSKRVLGDEHPDTKNTQSGRDACARQLGR